jgi:predicted nucleic acid-binding protein
MNLYKLSSIPSNEKVLFDTNIFVYSALDHPKYGESCTEAFQRVESKELKGYVPTIVLNELLHRLMIAEVIRKKLARNTGEVLELLKHDRSIIPSLNTCWEELDRIFAAGFMVLEDRSNIFRKAISISREYSLLSSDAYIASFARVYGITNIATNDGDFERVEWLKVWKP